MGWKMVVNFLGNDEKQGEISTYFRFKHHCGKKVGHFSVQCIQTKITWLPTLNLNASNWAKYSSSEKRIKTRGNSF